MNYYRHLILLPVLLFSACNRDKIETKVDAQGVTISLSPVWRSSVSENDKYIADGIGQSFVTSKGVLFPKSTALPRDPQLSRSYITLKDQVTGHDIWEWNDFLTNFEQLGMYKNQQDNVNGIIFLSSGNRGYGIDTQTGRTVWKTTYSDFWASVATATGLDRFYLTLNPAESYNKSVFKPKLFEGQLNIGSITALVSPVFGLDKGKEGGGYKEDFGQINGMKLLNLGGDEHLLFDYYDSTYPTNYWYTPRISLYNLTQKKFVYEGLAMKDAGYLLAVNGHLQVNNGKVYDAMARYTVCHDLLTGKQLWERPLAHSVIISLLLITSCSPTSLTGICIAWMPTRAKPFGNRSAWWAATLPTSTGWFITRPTGSCGRWMPKRASCCGG